LTTIVTMLLVVAIAACLWPTRRAWARSGDGAQYE
jgi:hypothetical protein